MISCYLSDYHKEWDKNIAAVGCAIRTSKSETGFTPFCINFGRKYVGDGRYYGIHLSDRKDTFDMDSELKNRQTGFVKLFQEVERNLQST